MKIEILAVHCFLLLGYEAPCSSLNMHKDLTTLRDRGLPFREKTLTVVSIPNSALASILHALDFPLPLILTFVREIDCFNKILAEKEF